MAHLVFVGRRSGDGVASALVVVVGHLHVEIGAAGRGAPSLCKHAVSPLEQNRSVGTIRRSKGSWGRVSRFF